MNEFYQIDNENEYMNKNKPVKDFYTFFNLFASYHDIMLTWKYTYVTIFG